MHSPNPDITTIGEALYGSRWTSELARAIGVSDRYVRMLASGERPMTDALRDELLALSVRRVGEIEAAVGVISCHHP